ncbi:MAG: CARDB domain-containing protein [Thermoplasmata archaeon]
MRRISILIVVFLISASFGTLFNVSGVNDVPGAEPTSAGSQDIPTWRIGTSWTYEQDFQADNMDLDERLTYTVAAIEFIDIDGISIPVYRVELDGELLGGSASGDYDVVFSGGYYEGYTLYRMDNLGVVVDYQYRFLYGTVQAPFNPRIEIETDTTTTNLPDLDNYDFSLNQGGHFWANNTIHREGYIEVRAGGNTNTEIVDDIEDYDRYVHVAEGVSSVTTPAGTFDSYLITHEESGYDTGTVELYYNGDVQNNVQEVVDRTDRANRVRVLESYNVPGNPNSLTVEPSEAYAGQTVTVTGSFPDHPSSEFTLGIPSSGFSQDVQTDASGAFTTEIMAPEVDSNTPSPGIHGKVGIVAYLTSSPSSVYQAATLTVLEAPPGTPPSVTLLSPNGGETFTAGTQEEISWVTSQGDSPINNLDIKFSSDEGDTWTPVATGIPDDGDHMWTVNLQSSDTCLIKVVVRDTYGRTGTDESDGYFTVEGIAPDPPTDLNVDHYGIGFGILFEDDLEDGDKGYTTGISNTGSEWGIRSYGASSGTHSWDFGEGEYYKTSSYGYLSWLISPEISIPEEADYVELSFDHWRSFGALTTLLDGGNVKISTNGVNGDFSIITPNEGYDGAINDNYGNPLGGQQAWSREEDWETVTFDLTAYVGQNVHLRWDAGIEAYDEDMEEGWRIDNILVTAEGIISDGNEHNMVTWGPSPDDPEDVSHYNIYRSDSNPGDYDLISSVDAVGLDEYNYIDWDKGTEDDILWWYIVRAVSKDALEEDNNNAVPEPGDIPSITVNRPNGGEIFSAGTHEDIEWTAEQGGSPIDYINLSYSINGGVTWTTIESGISDQGNYSWLVPNYGSTECLVRAAAVDTQELSGVDISDGYFTIETLPPEPPSDLNVKHYGADDLVDNGVFLDGYEPWILTRVVDDGEAGWDNQSHLQGGSIHVQAEAKGINNITTEESHWEQEIVPTSEPVSFSGAFRKYITTQGVGPRASKVNHAEIQVRVHDTDTGWQTLGSDNDTSDGDTGWVEFEDVIYEPLGTVDAVRIWMHVEAEGNSAQFIDRRAEGEIWMDHISLTILGQEKKHNLISWNPSPGDPDEVLRYNVYRSESEEGPWGSSIGSVYAQSSLYYEYVDENKGEGDDIHWWYKVHAEDDAGRECEGTVPVQEHQAVQFNVSVEDIAAGEQPLIVIYDAEDDQGVSMEGEYQVTTTINGVTDTTDLMFTSGHGEYSWDEITTVGSYEVNVIIEGVTEYDNFYVSTAAVDCIVVSPDAVTITAGDTQTYAAAAYDEYDNEIGDVTVDTLWSISEGAGGSWYDCVYTSEAVGTWTVTGAYGGVTGTSTLEVLPGDVVSVEIQPSQDQTVKVNVTLQFSAGAYDEYDNLITDDPEDFTWQNTDTQGIFNKDTPGEYSVTATYDGVSSATVMVTVESLSEDEPFFNVEIISFDDEVMVDDIVSMEYTVENIGYLEDVQDIVFTVDGVQEDIHGDLTLDEEEVYSGTFTWTAEDEGTYNLEVSSDDDSDSVMVTVETPELDDPYFEVEILEFDSEVEEGDEVSLEYKVRNTGGIQGTQDIVFNIDGVHEDVVYASLTLAAGAEHTDEFTWTAENEGTYNLEVSSDDDSDSVMVTVETPELDDPYFEVEILEFDSEVEEGDEVSLEYKVRNTGGIQGTQDIVFSIDGVPEDVVYASLTLAAGAEHTDEFTWVTVEAGTFTLEIACDDDSDSVTITVDPGPEDEPLFRVEITEHDEEVEEDGEVTVSYRVWNTGGTQGTQSIVFSIDDIQEDVHADLMLEPEQEHTGEFTWTATNEGNYTLKVESDDRDDSVMVTVNGEDDNDDSNGGQDAADPSFLEENWWLILLLIIVIITIVVVMKRGEEKQGEENFSQEDLDPPEEEDFSYDDESVDTSLGKTEKTQQPKDVEPKKILKKKESSMENNN